MSRNAQVQASTCSALNRLGVASIAIAIVAWPNVGRAFYQPTSNTRAAADPASGGANGSRTPSSAFSSIGEFTPSWAKASG